jgi:hypothetical protein
MKVVPNIFAIAFLIDSAIGQPSFLSFTVDPAPQIEWDQTSYLYYTGQTINTSWSAENMLSTDTATITYQGAGGTRTLTSGSGSLIGNGSSYAARLSDSSNGLATNVPLTITLSRTASINRQSSQLISVVQSKLMNIVPLDGNRTLGGGQNIVCDDRTLTLQWRGLGRAQFGTASVILRRQSGFTGTQILASVSNIPVSGNMSLFLLCPRTATPSSSNPYAFQITVSEPGGSDYTGTSASFTVATAPTPSNTPTRSPTPSNSPTPSISVSNTPTSSPSFSNTPTPSSSLTPSTTETARPSIDYAAIARTAAESVDTTTPAVAGALGGIGGILILLGGGKWYYTKVQTEKRKRKQAMTSRWVQEASSVYGVSSSTPDTAPNIVMYTVATSPGIRNGLTDPRQVDSYKKAFPPKQTGSK